MTTRGAKSILRAILQNQALSQRGAFEVFESSQRTVRSVPTVQRGPSCNPVLQVLPIPPPQFQIPNTTQQQNLMFPQQQQPNAQQAMSLMPQLPPIFIPQLPNNISMQQNQMWQQPFMNTTAAAMQQNQQPINPYRQNRQMNPYNQNPRPNPTNP